MRPTAMETFGTIVTLETEIQRLRAINAELVRIVLDDTEGDLDFVKFRVRALFKCKLQPMSDHLIIRLRRAFDETGNSLLSDAIEELAHRSIINAGLLAALEFVRSDPCYIKLGSVTHDTVRAAIIQACAFCQENKGKMAPHHFASSRCESGKRNHCSCDICF